MTDQTDTPGHDTYVPENFDAASHAVAMARTVGLVIAPERMPGVQRYLNVAHSVARMALRVPLDESRLHMASIFVPVEPQAGSGGRDDG